MGYPGTHKTCTQAGGKGHFVAWLLLLGQSLAEGTYRNAFVEEMFCLWKGPAFISLELFSEVCPGKSVSWPRLPG